MKSPRISTRNSRKLLTGFTLLEVMIVIAIVGVLAGFGLFVSMGFYKSYSFNSERNLVVSILEKARNQAVDNFNQSAFGVRFEAGRYIIFQGTAYVNGDPNNEILNAQPAITNNGPLEIVFSQLSGETATPGSITITDGTRSSAITVNNEGGIDW